MLNIKIFRNIVVISFLCFLSYLYYDFYKLEKIIELNNKISNSTGEIIKNISVKTDDDNNWIKPRSGVEVLLSYENLNNNLKTKNEEIYKNMTESDIYWLSLVVGDNMLYLKENKLIGKFKQEDYENLIEQYKSINEILNALNERKKTEKIKIYNKSLYYKIITSVGKLDKEIFYTLNNKININNKTKFEIITTDNYNDYFKIKDVEKRIEYYLKVRDLLNKE